MTMTTQRTVAPEEDFDINPLGQGCTNIYSTVMERLPDNPDEPGIWRAKMHMGGAHWLTARLMAANEVLLADDSDTAKADSVIEMAAKTGGKVSGLFITENGARVQEGRVMRGNGEDVGLFNKGSNLKYRPLAKGKHWPVRALRNYGRVGYLAHDLRMALTHVPRTCEVSREQLAALPHGRARDEIAAVYLHTFPGFGDGPTYGCIWLVTDYQRPKDGSEGILNGFLWVPGDSGLEAEHGSFYERDLFSRPFGQLVDYVPGSFKFSDCWNLPPSRVEAYRAVLGLDYAQE